MRKKDFDRHDEVQVRYRGDQCGEKRGQTSSATKREVGWSIGRVLLLLLLRTRLCFVLGYKEC